MDRKMAGILLLILSLLPMYVGAIHLLPSDISFNDCGVSGSQNSTENVGFCTKVSATVERNYYLGLVDLKTYALGINIDPVTRIMPYLIMFMMAGSFKIYKQA